MDSIKNEATNNLQTRVGKRQNNSASRKSQCHLDVQHVTGAYKRTTSTRSKSNGCRKAQFKLPGVVEFDERKWRPSLVFQVDKQHFTELVE